MSKVAAVIGSAVALVVAALLRVALVAFVFMVAVGVVHAQWLTDMPTIGYVGALGVSLALMLVRVVFATGTDDK
ncbi:hypothetical protein [Micromonospora sp. WMMD980]|uniref:hypothetical protein n=1 Tax=Micromonospora sp. WMMD980 TaxID=3016088 RepID=UPI002415FBA1|nr:hypothetical protein [Micromonospora sp. WMMD980]MDG4801705.1 hypothetical protein [Micromonospora sp. WMMD980]